MLDLLQDKSPHVVSVPDSDLTAAMSLDAAGDGVVTVYTEFGAAFSLDAGRLDDLAQLLLNARDLRRTVIGLPDVVTVEHFLPRAA